MISTVQEMDEAPAGCRMYWLDGSAALMKHELAYGYVAKRYGYLYAGQVLLCNANVVQWPDGEWSAKHGLGMNRTYGPRRTTWEHAARDAEAWTASNALMVLDALTAPDAVTS